METNEVDVFDIVLAVCEQHDGLCMDVSAERLRLAFEITAALREADVIADRSW